MMEKICTGKVLNDSIAIDCLYEEVRNGIYFLTEGYLDDPLPPYVDRVYTSPYNAKLLQKKFNVGPDIFVGLDMNKKLLIRDDKKDLYFHVTLMEAKQKPGAVMFLFEGDSSIGNILYAGQCCYSDNSFCRPLCSFLKSKVLDYLYIHDACAECHVHSKTVTLAVEEICEIARSNPKSKLFIVEPCFREDILKCLKDKLKCKISVSENIMKHLEDLGEGLDFSLSNESVKVLVTDQPHEKWRTLNVPVQKVLLVPCSSKISLKEASAKKKELKKRGYIVIFYRNHCSKPELLSLVRDVNAKFNVLISPLPINYGAEFYNRKLDENYWSHMGNFGEIFAALDKFQSMSKSVQKASEVEDEVELKTCIENEPQHYGLDICDSSGELKLEDSTPNRGKKEDPTNIWSESDSESVSNK